MRHRLIAGTINAWPALDNGWRNWTLDVQPRTIWSRELEMGILPDFVADIGEGLADFRENTFDEIRCHHVLEHLFYEQAVAAVSAFARILKTEGRLDVETPDVLKVIDAWGRDELDLRDLNQWLYGEHLPNHDAADTHKTGWSRGSLWELVSDAGFALVEEPAAGLSCRLIVVKP